MAGWGKKTEAKQSKAQGRSWRGELGASAKGLTHGPQSPDSVPTGSGEPWKVFSGGMAWPDSGAKPTDTFGLTLRP